MEYHKIQTVFKRNPEDKYKSLLIGEYTLPEFEYLKDNKWIFTEKVDGTNIRVYYENGRVRFGGRTDRAQIPTALIERLQERFYPENVGSIFDDGVCLYGEGYGAKIQKGGGNYRSDQDFVLFDIKIGEYWLQRPDLEAIAEKLGIDIVPILGKGTLTEMVELAKEGFSSTWGLFEAEGFVARPATELKARNGQRIITKIKCRDFRDQFNGRTSAFDAGNLGSSPRSLAITLKEVIWNIYVMTSITKPLANTARTDLVSTQNIALTSKALKTRVNYRRRKMICEKCGLDNLPSLDNKYRCERCNAVLYKTNLKASDYSQFCRSKNCEFFIEWEFDTEFGLFPCKSCIKIGQSYEVKRYPNDCPFINEISQSDDKSPSPCRPKHEVVEEGISKD